MNNIVINIQKEVNPNFRDVWTTKKPNNILKGGRNSFKSSVIALKLVYMLIPFIKAGEKANIVVIRKVANTIRDSVFNKMQWALSKFGFRVGKNGDFIDRKAPFLLIHNKTGSTIYFYGQDDFQKLKSNDIGNIIAVWYEEAAEFQSEEEFDQSNITFMRQKHDLVNYVLFFWSYNPPKNPYAWINEWSERMKSDDNYLVHESSYLDDRLGFVTGQMLKDIERIKNTDYDYYRYIYLGEAVGFGDNVYNMDLFNIVKDIESIGNTNERVIKLYFSVDTGHSVSATACSAYGYTNYKNIILLGTDYYNPQGKVKKRSPLEHVKALRAFEKRILKHYPVPIVKKTIDSADGAMRNQYFSEYGHKLHPVNKGKKVDMIDEVIDLLVTGRFYVLDRDDNQVFINEHRMYRWDNDSLEHNPDNPSVIKVDDHTCDNFQYFVRDNLRDLGLKY